MEEIGVRTRTAIERLNTWQAARVRRAKGGLSTDFAPAA